MPITNTEPSTLNVEDFRRLGVRPNELRLAVIRRAIVRTSRSLSKRCLQAKSTEDALQLSRVATSAYRLMDPRLRTNIHQRAHVGRILPSTLSLAGNTNFFNRAGAADASFAGSDPSESDSSATETVDANEWIAGIDFPSLETPVARNSDTVWLQKLGDDDLLESTPQSRRLKRLRRKLLPSWTWFAIGGLIASVAVGFSTMAPKFDSPYSQAIEQTTASRVPASVRQPSILEQELPAPSNQSAEPIVESERTEFLPDPFANPITYAAPLVSPADSDDTEMLAPSVFLPSSNDGEPKNNLLANRDLASVANPTPNEPAEAFATAPLPTAPAEPTESPDEARVREFLEKVDDADTEGPNNDLHRIGLALCESLLAGESFDRCDQITDRLMSTDFSGARSSKLADVNAVRLATKQMRRMHHSLAQYTQSPRTLQQQIDSTSIKAEIEHAGALGRYECLMLRRWNYDSLSRLTESTDTRIASLARQELAMPVDAPADELADMAQRWLSAAKRADGRASESMQLHAIDWMQRASNAASGLLRLNQLRLIDEQLDTLPLHLRTPFALLATSPLAPTAFLEIQTPADQPTIKQTPTPSPSTESSMSGRMLAIFDAEADATDLGVQIDYQLDVAIKPSMIQTVRKRFKQEISGLKFRFVGDLNLDRVQMAKVSIAAGVDARKQSVSIDGTCVTFDPLDSATEILLSAGAHRVVWTFDSENLASAIFLGIHDADTGLRIPMAPANDNALPLQTELTVTMLRSDN
ncbi:hypothetical protein [Rubripirellula reticaptiva]|nr:hypothetical protein [Rubripirellula reticaptiva]